MAKKQQNVIDQTGLIFDFCKRIDNNKSTVFLIGCGLIIIEELPKDLLGGCHLNCFTVIRCRLALAYLK